MDKKKCRVAIRCSRSSSTTPFSAHCLNDKCRILNWCSVLSLSISLSLCITQMWALFRRCFYYSTHIINPAKLGKTNEETGFYFCEMSGSLQRFCLTRTMSHLPVAAMLLSLTNWFCLVSPSFSYVSWLLE